MGDLDSSLVRKMPNLTRGFFDSARVLARPEAAAAASRFFKRSLADRAREVPTSDEEFFSKYARTVVSTLVTPDVKKL